MTAKNNISLDAAFKAALVEELGINDKTDNADFVEIDVNSNLVLRDLQRLGHNIKSFPFGAGSFGSSVSTTALSGGNMHGSLTYITKSTLVTGISYIQTIAGDHISTGLKEGFAIYSYNPATNTATKVYTTPNNESVWKSSGWKKEALVAPVTLAEGWYFICLLYTHGGQTTAPVVHLMAGGWPYNYPESAIRVSIRIASLTDFPASFATTEGVLGQGIYAMFLY